MSTLGEPLNVYIATMNESIANQADVFRLVLLPSVFFDVIQVNKKA